jgi:hypothetical protein
VTTAEAGALVGWAALFVACTSSDAAHPPTGVRVVDAGVPEVLGPASVDAGGSEAHAPPGVDGGASGDAAGLRDASMGADSADDAMVPAVGMCPNLPAPGVWQETTPQAVRAAVEAGTNPYGAEALAVDPSNTGTAYFGTDAMGIWKSTDCGGTWSHVNTGTNGAALDSGMQWSLVVDPKAPAVLYANSGYGNASNGAWKSTNGGVDWQRIWPPSDPTLASVVQYNFVHKIRVDPTNHLHLLLSFHAPCSPPYTIACIGQSLDGGATWEIVNGDSSWGYSGGEDETIWFLDDSDSWLWGSPSNGLWSTADGGGSWTLINSSWGGHNGGQLYRAADGTFYLAAPPGLLRRGSAGDWSLLTDVGSLMIGITGDGTTMYASRGPYPQSPPIYPYFTSLEADGTAWSSLASPSLSNGGYELGYDRPHHVLYASSFGAGFWRVVTQ